MYQSPNATTINDYAQIDVTVAGLSAEKTVVCSRRVRIVPDVSLDAIDEYGDFDAVILPGGLGGAKSFAEVFCICLLKVSSFTRPQSTAVKTILNQFNEAEKFVCAICAAPIALKSAKVGIKKMITSHPSVREELAGDYAYQEDRVVIDGNLVTSRGPGTTFEFALTIIRLLCGIDASKRVSEPLLLPKAVLESLGL
jgi:protein DJ-1